MGSELSEQVSERIQELVGTQNFSPDSRRVLFKLWWSSCAPEAFYLNIAWTLVDRCRSSSCKRLTSYRPFQLPSASARRATNGTESSMKVVTPSAGPVKPSRPSSLCQADAHAANKGWWRHCWRQARARQLSCLEGLKAVSKVHQCS